MPVFGGPMVRRDVAYDVAVAMGGVVGRRLTTPVAEAGSDVGSPSAQKTKKIITIHIHRVKLPQLVISFYSLLFQRRPSPPMRDRLHVRRVCLLIRTPA